MTKSKWVITYNDIENHSLLSDYETIEGKTAFDALKKKFNKEFERLTGDAGRYANIILIKGYFQNNNIYYVGKCQRLCYGIKY